jgi:epidermal growth factor receptor substrate 15
MSGQLPFVPTSLPPGLYEQAGGLPAGVATHGTGSSGFQSPALTGGFPGRAPIAQQYTGASTASPMQQQMTGSKLGPPLPARNANPAAALGASAFGITPQFTGQSQGPPWDVTAAEKVNSDRFFDGIDTQRAGFIEGDAAVSFLTQSGLPGDVLATIWDLSDINDDGRLTKDEFAVAMHLIQNQLAGKDVPATLPLSLIPPAFRGLAGQGQSQMHVSPAQAHVEPLRDLLWDDTPPVSASQPMLQPQSTGATARPPPPPVPGRGIAPPMPVASPAQDPFGGSTAAYGAAYPASAGPFGNPSGQLLSPTHSC